nr:tetratricopeptide repeat-containing protein [Mediterraneibacter faecis]
MGFSTKKIPNTNIEVNLDDTYNYLIKPALIEMDLVAVNCSERNKHSYRCDEIFTTEAINETFIRNIYLADIVVADITTLNQNAIYELGMRHAMKPKSTIILCDKKTLQNNSFFDLTFNPHIIYDSEKQKDIDEINRVSNILKSVIETCKKADDSYIDSPVFSYDIYNQAIISTQSNKMSEALSLRYLLNEGQNHLENQEYDFAEKTYEKIIKNYGYDDVEIYCLYILAMYKRDLSEDNLKKSFKILQKYINLETTTCENALGIAAAIHLRLFELTKQKNDLYLAIEFYRKGMYYESGNLYCGKNYCSTLLKIYLIEEDPHILKEYYYTAVHTAKILLTQAQSLKRHTDDFNNAWFLSNQNALFTISTGLKNKVYNVCYQSQRQQVTVEEGMMTLYHDIEQIKKLANIN